MLLGCAVFPVACSGDHVTTHPPSPCSGTQPLILPFPACAPEIIPFDTAPTPARMVAAEYPEEARRQECEGTVDLLITIDEDGEVCAVSIQDSDAGTYLEQAAVDAIVQWSFNPALFQGNPVAAQLIIPMRFSLH
jgi:protein TonB